LVPEKPDPDFAESGADHEQSGFDADNDTDRLGGEVEGVPKKKRTGTVRGPAGALGRSDRCANHLNAYHHVTIA
jgi:hypothetical protein